jgi:hypothetical protein
MFPGSRSMRRCWILRNEMPMAFMNWPQARALPPPPRTPALGGETLSEQHFADWHRVYFASAIAATRALTARI